MATKCVAHGGYRATCVDFEDHRAHYAKGEGTCFDILSNSGLVFS